MWYFVGLFDLIIVLHIFVTIETLISFYFTFNSEGFRYLCGVCLVLVVCRFTVFC